MENRENMDHKNGFTLTNRDRVVKSWMSSTELVRDYQAYAQQNEHDGGDRELKELFAGFAETEAEHAARLLRILQQEEKKRMF